MLSILRAHLQFSLRCWFQEPRRDAADNAVVGYIVDDNRVCADDHVISYGDPPEYFGACADLHAAADGGRPQRIAVTSVSESHAVSDQTIVAYDARSVNDDTTVVFDTQPSADARRGSDAYAAKNLGHPVQNHIYKGPRRTDDFVAHHEPRMTESIYQERPNADTHQSFALRFYVFEDDIHAGYCRVSMDGKGGGVRH
jgi:hypothetical protein